MRTFSLNLHYHVESRMQSRHMAKSYNNPYGFPVLHSFQFYPRSQAFSAVAQCHPDPPAANARSNKTSCAHAPPHPPVVLSVENGFSVYLATRR